MKTSQQDTDYIGLKFRFYPAGDQPPVLNQTFGNVRWLYNHCITLRQAQYEANKDLAKEDKTYLSAQDLIKQLPILKKEKFNLDKDYLSTLHLLHDEAGLNIDWLSISNNDFGNIPKHYWLEKNCLASALQQTVRHADNAYKRFYDSLNNGKIGSVRLPQFKTRSSRQSFTITQSSLNFTFKNEELKKDYKKKIKFLAKTNPEITNNQLYYIEKLSSPLTEYDLTLSGTTTKLDIHFDKRAQHVKASDIKSINISKNAKGQYFITFLVPRKKELINKNIISNQPSIEAANPTVGIDVGVKTTATIYSTTSDILTEKKLKNFKRYSKRLRSAQRNLSKKKVGSNSFNKQKLKVASIHQDLVNYRTNFYQELSTELLKNNHTVYVEDLNIKGMVKNKKLAKAISLQSWGMFYNMLLYKAQFYGKSVEKVDRYFPSSKICSDCCHYNRYYGLPEKPLNKQGKPLRFFIPDTWSCSNCGVKHQRDENAAKNIAHYGDLKSHYKYLIAESIQKDLMKIDTIQITNEDNAHLLNKETNNYVPESCGELANTNLAYTGGDVRRNIEDFSSIAAVVETRTDIRLT